MPGKLIIIAALATLVYNLGAGLCFMMVDQGGNYRTVNALMWRIALPVGLIALVNVAIRMGWMQPHGING